MSCRAGFALRSRQGLPHRVSGTRATGPRRAPPHDAARCAASTAVGSAMGLERVHGQLACLARLIGRVLSLRACARRLTVESQVTVQGLEEAPRLARKAQTQPKLLLAGYGHQRLVIRKEYLGSVA